jgi:predicted phage tail component-like protein
MPGTYFVFNGIDSRSYDINVSKLERPILPKTRERLLTIPTKHGQYDFGPYFEPMTITLTCWVSEISRANLLSMTDNIAVWLDPRAGAKQLVISDQTDRYWNARYSGTLDIAYIVGYGEFKIPFLCVDPFAHSI